MWPWNHTAKSRSNSPGLQRDFSPQRCILAVSVPKSSHPLGTPECDLNWKQIFGDIISQGHARLGVAPNILCLVSYMKRKTETHRGGGRVMRETGVNA